MEHIHGDGDGAVASSSWCSGSLSVGSSRSSTTVISGTGGTSWCLLFSTILATTCHTCSRTSCPPTSPSAVSHNLFESTSTMCTREAFETSIGSTIWVNTSSILWNTLVNTFCMICDVFVNNKVFHCVFVCDDNKQSFVLTKGIAQGHDEGTQIPSRTGTSAPSTRGTVCFAPAVLLSMPLCCRDGPEVSRG